MSDLGLQEHVKGNLTAAVDRLRAASSPGAAPGYIAQTALLRLGDALTAQGLEAMASEDVEKAKSLFEEAKVVFEDLEEQAGENSSLGRTAKQRKERVPHLSIKPLTPEEAAAKAAAATPAPDADPPVADLVDPLTAPPVSEPPADSDASTLPPADLTPPEEATLPPADDASDGTG